MYTVVQFRMQALFVTVFEFSNGIIVRARAVGSSVTRNLIAKPLR
jgi:hypothetical protein